MNEVFEEVLRKSKETNWFENIGELFEKFVITISKAATGESPSFNEARVTDSGYIRNLIAAEKNYFHIKDQLDFSNKRNTIDGRNNLVNDPDPSKREDPLIDINTVPSVCMEINANTDRMRRLEVYLQSEEENEFKKTILIATIAIYKKMLNELRLSLDTYNKSGISTENKIPINFIPEPF